MNDSMGFQHLREPVLKAATRKGGRRKTDKGFAKMSPERLREVSLLGVQARKENRSNSDTIKEEDDTNLNSGLMERILTSVGENE